MNEKLDTEPRNRQNPPIPKQGVIFKTWGYSQGKSTLKWNFSACKKRFLNWNNIFKRIKQLLAKLRSLCLKIGLKIKVIVTQNHADLSNGGLFLKSLFCFLEETTLLLLALNWNLQEKVFFCVKTKTNSNFAEKLAQRSNRSCSVYLMNNLFQVSRQFNM